MISFLTTEEGLSVSPVFIDIPWVDLVNFVSNPLFYVLLVFTFTAVISLNW